MNSFKKVAAMEKIISLIKYGFVFVFSIALICEANEIEKEKSETSNSTELTKEDKAITILEEALTLLKERKEQIGNIIRLSNFKKLLFFIFSKIKTFEIYLAKLNTFADKAIKSRKVPVENITEFLANRNDDYHPAHHPIAAMTLLRQCVVYKLENLAK